MERRGWVGTLGQLKHYLYIVGADKDESGKYLVGGTIASYMGMDSDNADVVVGADAYYLVDGHRAGLAAAMRSTSYGLGIVVI